MFLYSPIAQRHWPLSRSLMWDSIERRVLVGTFRGRKDFEIQWMCLHVFCLNLISAPAVYFYLNLMLSRVHRQGRKERVHSPDCMWSCSDGGVSVIHKLSCMKGKISKIQGQLVYVHNRGTYICGVAKMFAQVDATQISSSGSSCSATVSVHTKQLNGWIKKTQV